MELRLWKSVWGEPSEEPGKLISPFLRLVVGALGGLSATGPMTICMILLHRWLPERHRYSLPPREITVHLAEKAGVHRDLGPDARAALTLVNHFGYGAASAAVYSLAAERFPGGYLKGLAFGAAVWFVSYFGLLPAVGILHSALRHPLSRSGLMFVAHLVWGFAVAVFVETVLSEKKDAFGALLGTSPIRQKDRR